MIKIGNVQIEGNIALSPMAGISDSPYRRITRAYGSAFSYTEFVSTEHIVQGNQKSLDMFRFQEMERPIYFQIFGSDLNKVIESSKRIEHLEPDVIDLNMGCSVAKVSHNGSGAGLLRNLQLAGNMIEGIRKSVKTPVTAKIRLGWDEKSVNYRQTIDVLQDSGVSAISVHGRTKSMGYSGVADWNAIGDIKSRAKVPIFGNGDIASYEDAQKKIRAYGVDLVLVGRKAIGNPWIFNSSSKQDVSFQEIREVMIQHLTSMLEFYPSNDDYALILFRKHFVRYIEGIGFPSSERRKLLEINNASEFLKILENVELVEIENQLLQAVDSIDCETFSNN